MRRRAFFSLALLSLPAAALAQQPGHHAALARLRPAAHGGGAR